MGFLDFLFGESPQQQVHYPPALRPPLYDTVGGWGPTISSLWDTPLPSYQGQIDPGLGPMMQNALNMAQQWAVSPAPAALGEAYSSLGSLTSPGMGGMGGNMGMHSNPLAGPSMQSLLRFMNPTWLTPQARGGSYTDFYGGGSMGGGSMGGQYPGDGGMGQMPLPRPMPPMGGYPWGGGGALGGEIPYGNDTFSQPGYQPGYPPGYPSPPIPYGNDTFSQPGYPSPPQGGGPPAVANLDRAFGAFSTAMDRRQNQASKAGGAYDAGQFQKYIGKQPAFQEMYAKFVESNPSWAGRVPKAGGQRQQWLADIDKYLQRTSTTKSKKKQP